MSYPHRLSPLLSGRGCKVTRLGRDVEHVPVRAPLYHPHYRSLLYSVGNVRCALVTRRYALRPYVLMTGRLSPDALPVCQTCYRRYRLAVE